MYRWAIIFISPLLFSWCEQCHDGLLSVCVHTCLPFLRQAGPSEGCGSCRREIPRGGGTGPECVNDPEDEMLWKQLGLVYVFLSLTGYLWLWARPLEILRFQVSGTSGF